MRLNILEIATLTAFARNDSVFLRRLVIAKENKVRLKQSHRKTYSCRMFKTGSTAKVEYW